MRKFLGFFFGGFLALVLLASVLSAVIWGTQ